jgi:hypothetical protein
MIDQWAEDVFDEVRKSRSKSNGDNGKSRRLLVLKPFDTITLSTRPNYLVKGILPRTGLAVVWGPSKCCKSFLTFDLMMHVALGWEYRGRRVQQGGVVYCALEGGSGFASRVEAWRRQHLSEHKSGPIPFWLLDVPLDLVADHASLAEAIRAQLGNSPAPAAIVIDTLNRALVGDENKSDDMAKLIRAADLLRTIFGCLVILVHHCGIAGNRPRGHTSLAGADDVQIAVSRNDDGTITAKVEHMKDGDASAPMASKLERIDLGKDDDGDTITSCIVVPVDVVPASKSTRANLTGNQTRFLDILREASDDAPAEHKTKSNIPDGRTAISREWLKTCCLSQGWFDTEASENNRRAKLSNMINALAAKRLIGAIGLFIWDAR